MPEIVLPGGYTNAGHVTRVGDTVRRPARPHSPAIRALLEHLEREGFDGAPRFLGVDERQREVLSFMPGEAALEPLADWAFSDEALVSVAQLLRRFHDATASFAASAHAWPDFVPEAFRDGVICHNDPNLDNVICVDGVAVGLIDFDLAAPGSAVWDVTCAARLWAPLRDERDVPEPVRGRTLERLRLFVDAYGLPMEQRPRIAEAAPLTHDRCYRVVRDAVGSGHGPFTRMWRSGGRDRAERTRHWLATHEAEMRQALSAG
jgi:hypothetical protein